MYRNADAAKTPAELENQFRSKWQPATVPGTVASALRQSGQWDVGQTLDFEHSDWWFRLKFDFKSDNPEGAHVLRFHGLATIAEVWLNGQSIHTSGNMFRDYSADVTPLLKEHNVSAYTLLLPKESAWHPPDSCALAHTIGRPVSSSDGFAPRSLDECRGGLPQSRRSVHGGLSF